MLLTLTDFTLERERYCLPDSRFVLVYKSRDFVPGYSRFARYCLPDRACCFSSLVVWFVLLFSRFVILLFCWMTILLEVTTNNQTTKQLNNQTTKHHYCTK